MEHIPASHAMQSGMQYPGRVVAVGESGLELELDLILLAPGRSPALRANLHFHRTVAPEQARRLAIGDAVNVVLFHYAFLGAWMRCSVSLPADPAWLTWNDETVRRLARHIQETGELHLLSVLADALEDAGCTDATLLDYCRQSHEDEIWSWAVELLATQE